MRLPSIDLAENRGDSLCVAEKGRLGDLSVIVHGALFRMPPMHHRLIFGTKSQHPRKRIRLEDYERLLDCNLQKRRTVGFIAGLSLHGALLRPLFGQASWQAFRISWKLFGPCFKVCCCGWLLLAALFFFVLIWCCSTFWPKKTNLRHSISMRFATTALSLYILSLGHKFWPKKIVFFETRHFTWFGWGILLLLHMGRWLPFVSFMDPRMWQLSYRRVKQQINQPCAIQALSTTNVEGWISQAS